MYKYCILTAIVSAVFSVLIIGCSTPCEEGETKDGSWPNESCVAGPGGQTPDLEESGETIWEKRVDEAGKYGSGWAVAISSSGAIFAAGSGNSLVSGSSGTDVFVKKFSADGTEDTVNWNKKIDQSSDEAAYSIAIDSNDNVYVVGKASNLISGTSSWDIWIKKFSSSGAEDTANWNKKIDGGSSLNGDIAYAVAVDSMNNVYLAGRGNNLLGGSNLDGWIKKFSSSGVEDTVNWNKFVGGSGDNEIIYALAIDSNDSVFAVGESSNASAQNMWIKKYSSSGVEETTNWNKTIDGNSNDDKALGIALAPDGSVFVAGTGYNIVSGSSQADWWIKKFSSSGVEDTANWNKKVDAGYGYAQGIGVNSNGDVYVIGWGSNLVGGSTARDVMVKKYSSSGIEVTTGWDKKLDWGGGACGTYGGDQGNDLAIDAVNGYLYTVGLACEALTGEDLWLGKYKQ